jgi:archaellin
LNHFNQLVKLSPGSDEIKLSQVIFTFNTQEKTSTLAYRGVNGKCIRNVTSGFVTRQQLVIASDLNTSWYNLTEDIDYDGNFSDKVRVMAGGTALEFNLTSVTPNYNFTIANISAAGLTSVAFDVAKVNINPLNSTYGKIRINGTTNMNGTLLPNMVTIYPAGEGEGFFSVEYLQTGTNHVPGNLQKGDLIKLCFEAPQDIGEDVQVRMNFIPKIGTATLTEFVTPDVISTERVYLYP